MYFVSLLRRLVTKSYLRYSVNYHTVKVLPSTMTTFVEKQLHLLEIEHLAEVEEKNYEAANMSTKLLQRKGVCIPKLIITSLETGLYGRIVASFSLRTINKTFPFNILSPGDIVKLNYSSEEKPNEEECNGIVTKISDEAVIVAFDSLAFRDTLDSLNQHGKSVALIKVANKVTYERLKHAMKDLGRFSNGPAKYLVDVLFGDSPPSSSAPFEVSLHNELLNQCQRDAVSFALTQREIAIIHGPPGTGKTTTVIEIIAQLVKSGQKVLACAPSNVAVDNLLEKLSSLEVSTISHGFNTTSSSRRLKLVRLGHPARMLDPRLQKMSLDALVYNSSSGSIIRDVKKDIERLQAKLRLHSYGHQQRLLYKERRDLMAELRKRERKAIRDVLSPADVVLATNVGAYPRGPLQNVPSDHFDVVVIDECGQALEAACWVPLMKAGKCILAGDHLQLSPTIVSNEAAAEGLSLTLLERLIDLHGHKVVCMLTEQYRMNDVIMQWASKQMYDDKLTAHQSVEKHLLSDKSGVESTDNTEIPMLLIDTAGCDMAEAESEESDSKANEGEVKIVVQHVLSLIEAGVNPGDIAVISPYNLQVDILRNIFHDLHPRLEAKSVDGFQGREKEAVVLSLVRSNNDGEVGFLCDNRRLNVAVTRARRHIAVICDSETVSKDIFIKSLLDYMNEHGEVRSGFEYMHSDGVDDHVLNSIQTFHLVTPASTTENAKGKTKANAIPTSEGKTKKKSHTTKKSRDLQPTSLDDLELKAAYRDIITKHRQLFRENFSERLLKTFENELSGALDIEIVKDEFKIIFPSNLTSQERKVVHEICEELPLPHHSTGEGASRRVCVIFPENKPELEIAAEKEIENTESLTHQTEDVETVTEIDDVSNRFDVIEIDDVMTTDDEVDMFSVENTGVNEEDLLETVEETPIATVEAVPPGFAVCQKCGKLLPKDNMTLHLMHCERMMKLKMEADAVKNKSAKTSKSSGTKKQKQTRKKNSKIKVSKADDFDETVDEAIASNKICSHGTCNTRVSTIGQVCVICKRTFCMSHSLPEVHGCGKRAKASARKQIIRDGVLYPGSGVPSKKPPPDKRAVLKYRLNSKLKTMEESRQSSNKSKK